MPGPTFGVHEQPLFDALTALARRSQLRPAEAQRLCIEIEMGLARTDQLGTLEVIMQRFPALPAIAPRLMESPALQARTLRMLETILNALCSPSKSLTLPSAPVVRQRNA